MVMILYNIKGLLEHCYVVRRDKFNLRHIKLNKGHNIQI